MRDSVRASKMLIEAQSFFLGALVALKASGSMLRSKENFMFTKAVSVTSGVLAVAVMAGCCGERTAVLGVREVKSAEVCADMPPNAKVGECYAKVFLPPKTEVRTERVCVREASEKIEIIPAQYEWVEERILAKDASTELAAVPAEFDWKEQTVETASSHTGWMMRTDGYCRTENGQKAQDVFCLVDEPATTRTLRTQVVAKAATVSEVCVPAEYTTVRRQKLVTPARAHKVCIPAEYENVEKTVVVGSGCMEWQRVLCEVGPDNRHTLNAVKSALLAAGYTPGPLNGDFGDDDWMALKQYQTDHNLGVGKLSYQTLKQLGVSVQ